ncbi:MAG: hypothetical protein JWL69_1034 [Phycisphaerales bacterium]|nr:hypothetical protein [Phycisphaerales bacterium]MDB5357004.1 hypothetical protein [Phycisphaerales bacterium]
MANTRVFGQGIRKGLLGIVLGLLAAAPAMAGGGNVIPASADPKGYSLEDIAKATAVYNTGQVSGNPLTPSVPKVPFQILVGDATVKPGTMLYLPIYFADDSAPIIPPFPTDITNQDADADYLDGLIFDAFGVEAFLVEVDGKITVLTDDFIAGTTTPLLLDAPPADAGTHYIVAATFLTPLTPGKHTVALGGMIAGEPVVFLSYAVTVK